MSGNTDKPIENINDDLLGVTRYINGLSNFIRVCDTPTTIAIQGDWGSGKTSFMNMIREEISKDVVTIWFNTWQFSQFNLENRLPLILMATLVKQLASRSNHLDSSKEFLKTLGKIVLNLGNNVTANLTGVDVVDNIKKATESEDVIYDITRLKETFQNCVDQSLSTSGKEKLVIFIDDLDRLTPERAIEVLEILKLFLDCDKCVFVLAIDYDVVCRGINAKYGEGFDVKKGRSFFDKIIQVPFKMPTVNYEIEKYITSMLEKMKFFKDKPEVYVELISKSIGYNPRGMKRILNAFLLLKMIYGEDTIDSSHKQVVIFDVLCLQMASEKLYNYIAENEDSITSELLSEIAERSDYDGTQTNMLYEQLADIDNENEKELRIFLPAFCRVLKNEDGCITEQERDDLFDTIRISGTTSTVASSNFQSSYGYTDHDLETTKTLVNTDIKYNICTFGSKFHIGFGMPVTIIMSGKIYNAKTHNTSKGRVDGLKKLYEENRLSMGDSLKVNYVAADNTITIEKI